MQPNAALYLMQHQKYRSCAAAFKNATKEATAETNYASRGLCLARGEAATATAVPLYLRLLEDSSGFSEAAAVESPHRGSVASRQFPRGGVVYAALRPLCRHVPLPCVYCRDATATTPAVLLGPHTFLREQGRNRQRRRPRRGRLTH